MDSGDAAAEKETHDRLEQVNRIRDSLPAPSDEKPSRSVVETPEPTRDRGDIKTTPPSAADWQDFIGRIVIHTTLDAYSAWILKDVDMSEHEKASIELSRDDVREIAAPFAVYAAKNKWTRKHGREILGLTDSIEALLALGIWMRRVNRIARKHRPEKQNKRQQRHAHAPQPQPPIRETQERIMHNGSTGSDATEGIYKPPIPQGFPIESNGSG